MKRKIADVMTLMPHSIGADIEIKKAVEKMREYSFRHLPVQKGGEVVGVLTDRDLKLGASFPHADELTVEDVMTPDPYTVSPDTPLKTVLHSMAEHKYGCTLVIDGKKLVGIFTATDGLRLFADSL